MRLGTDEPSSIDELHICGPTLLELIEQHAKAFKAGEESIGLLCDGSSDVSIMDEFNDSYEGLIPSLSKLWLWPTNVFLMALPCINVTVFKLHLESKPDLSMGYTLSLSSSIV